MELIEDSLVELTLLLIRKLEIEKKLRQTFKCMLRKLFTCCGMKNIENEMKYLNESIKNLQKNKEFTSHTTQQIKKISYI